MGKSQACDKCCRLKIQCSLVPAGGRRGPKRKAESDAEETAQPKRLKPFVEVMRGEPTTREVLMEQSELLGELQDLQVRQLVVLEQHLEELTGARRSFSVIGYNLEELVERVSRLEEKSGSGSGSAEIRSI